MDCIVPNSASHGWRSICVGRDLLKNNLGTALGNGRETSIWSDDWLSLEEARRPMGPPTEDSSSMLVSDLISQENNEWNRAEIRRLLPFYEEEILNLRPSLLNGKDKIIWLPSKSGIYTPKEGYYEAVKRANTQDQTQPLTSPINWQKDVWNLQCSPKLHFFLWRAVREILPVGEALKARAINANTQCPHCGEEESTIHLLFTCRFARQIWSLAPFKQELQSHGIRSIYEGLLILKQTICLPPTGLGAGPLFPWLLWHIWCARNQKIFQDKQQLPEVSVQKAISMAREWQLAQNSNHKGSILKKQHEHLHLIPGVVNCKTDAAWSENTKLGGLGWVFSSANQPQRRGEAVRSNLGSPLLAEATAIFMAMQHAKDCNFNNLTIESDSQIAIKAINNGAQPKELHGILQDILFLSFHFCNISFCFIPRSANLLADSIAKNALHSFVAQLHEEV